MSDTSNTVPLRQVVQRETGKEGPIQKRRQIVGLPDPFESDCTDDLAGLALSGGGIRSACFNLGLIQAFHRAGLWKFFDYLSTVSGGGYIGAYLTSSVVADQKEINQDHFPLKELHSGHKQSPNILRFIYGGHYLFKPWQLFNKYFVGIVFNNLSIFSAIVALCAAAALLWRSLDYPWVRDRLALVDLDSDMLAPFLPYLFVAGAWLAAWIISYWRRGAEAAGFVARCLLYAKVGSLLIGITLLVGNGNIAIGSLAAFSEAPGAGAWSIPTSVWMPVVILISIALVPFLRPRRLLRSGTDPQHPWERWVFAVASAAFLVGVPLLVLGCLARENVSGYASDPHRPVVREEIKDWPGFVALLTAPEVSDQERTRRRIAERLGIENHREESPFHGWINNSATSGAVRLVLQTDPARRSKTQRQFVGASLTRLAESLDEKELLPDTELATWLSQNEPAAIDAALASYLEIQCSELNHALAEASRRLNDFKYLASGGAPQWGLTGIDDYALRTFSIAGWMTTLNPNSKAGHYWTQKRTVERLQDDLCRRFDRFILPSTRLFQRLNEQWKRREDAPGQARPAKKFQTLLAQARSAPLKPWPLYQRRELNRLLLEALYPGIFQQRTDVRRRVVIFADQWARAKWFLAALGVFFFAGIWTDMNATSLHRFYRTQITRAFIVPPKGGNHRISPALSDLKTTDFGGPYHLISASVSLFRKRFAQTDAHIIHGIRNPDQPSEHDPRWVDSFLFSQHYCGSEATGYVETPEYERRIVGENNRIDLADATAMSGAAFSPSQSNNWLIAFLMVALNLRLGQWLPNPRQGKPKCRPRFLPLLLSLRERADDRPYCFVTDGGHSENLGLVQLLKRRCRLIVVSDAGQDANHQFNDLARAIRTARIHGGVRLVSLESGEDGAEREFCTEPLTLHTLPREAGKHTGDDQSGDTGDDHAARPLNCERHFVVAHIVYPPQEQVQGEPPGDAAQQLQAEHAQGNREGLLIYLKPSFDGDEGVDLQQYRRANPNFPHQPTSDQLYDEAQVESYRRLGDHIGTDLCKLVDCSDSPDKTIWNAPINSVDELCAGLQAGLEHYRVSAAKSATKARPRKSKDSKKKKEHPSKQPLA